jgi:multiple antibiotic resistance protein
MDSLGLRAVDLVQTAIRAFVALFPVVNPIGDAPTLLPLTRCYPDSVRRVLAGKIGGYGFALLAASLVFGTEILSFLGISLVVVQIAGGLVVAVTGWKLLNQEVDDSTAVKETGTLEDALQHAFFPLTLPITVGPGCISIAITIGAHIRSTAGVGFEHGYPRHFLGALVGMLLVSVLVVVCYSNADRLVRTLGASGASIMMRLSAFILLAIGVQIMWNGLSSGIPQWLTPAVAH